MRCALIIVGKAPQPGMTKTRLVPPLSFDQAAELYGGFLLDAIDLGLQLGWERVSVVHPRGCAPALVELLPTAVQLLEQPGVGLQDALSSAFARHFAAGFERVVLVGSDNPTLPREPLEEGCAWLESHDLTIGPSVDGGYYLIGLRRDCPGVFDGIAWSTPRVYRQTLGRAAQLGLRVHAVQEWYDVDEAADLDRLQRDLAACPASVAPHTRAVLERLPALTAPR